MFYGINPEFERVNSVSSRGIKKLTLITKMLLNIGIVLIVLWLIGFIAFPVIGWLIHILLVVAIIMILLRIIKGK